MIDIWRFSLDDKTILEQKSVLSFDEVQRGNSFVFALDQERFLIGRIRLRLTLATYLGMAPEEIVFRYGLFGKPAIDGPVHFNCSHSNGTLVIALAENTRVGIDIEFLRPLSDLEGMMRHVFTTDEQEFVRVQPVSMQQQVFYQIWTRKEAVLKALGKGINASIAFFSVLSPSSAMLLDLNRDIADTYPAKWHVTDLTGLSDHSACALCQEATEQSEQPPVVFERNIVFRN
jgi:4'-phosphopantetheinyl transferase